MLRESGKEREMVVGPVFREPKLNPDLSDVVRFDGANRLPMRAAFGYHVRAAEVCVLRREISKKGTGYRDQRIVWATPLRWLDSV